MNRNRALSLVIGASITVFVCLVFVWFLPHPFNIALAIAVFFYFGVGGLIEIPVAFRGVPILLGGRLMVQQLLPDGTAVGRARFELGEGWNWILPRPLMAAEAIDTREQSVEVERFTVISANGVRVTVQSAVIRWRIVNSAQSLSVTEEVIKRSLIELIQQGLRSQIVALSDEVAIQAADNLRDELQRRADVRAAEWGIDIREVLIGEITRPEAVQADYELTQREARQRDAERIELDHVRECITELRDMGFSLERAQEIVQTERGKVKKEVREQQVTISPETRDAVRDVVTTLFGRRVT